MICPKGLNDFSEIWLYDICLFAVDIEYGEFLIFIIIYTKHAVIGDFNVFCKVFILLL